MHAWLGPRDGGSTYRGDPDGVPFDMEGQTCARVRPKGDMKRDRGQVPELVDPGRTGLKGGGDSLQHETDWSVPPLRQPSAPTTESL